MATPGPPNLEAVSAQAKRLINTQLKQVLKSSSLPVSGAKAALQGRIISREPHPQYLSEIDDLIDTALTSIAALSCFFVSLCLGPKR